MPVEIFRWWYTAGWRALLRRTSRNFTWLGQSFSAGTLLLTLFDPWKRVITYPGAGLDAHMRALVDNTVSRFVGFWIRLFVLVAFVFSAVILLIYNLVLLVAWPLIPLASIAAIVKGLM